MSKVKERIDQIKDQLVGNTKRRVLLVEGPDDVKAFRIFLERQFSERKWVLTEAGNKQQLIKILQIETDWLGLADRDEWSELEIEQ